MNASADGGRLRQRAGSSPRDAQEWLCRKKQCLRWQRQRRRPQHCRGPQQCRRGRRCQRRQQCRRQRRLLLDDDPRNGDVCLCLPPTTTTTARLRTRVVFADSRSHACPQQCRLPQQCRRGRRRRQQRRRRRRFWLDADQDNSDFCFCLTTTTTTATARLRRRVMFEDSCSRVCSPGLLRVSLPVRFVR